MRCSGFVPRRRIVWVWALVSLLSGCLGDCDARYVWQEPGLFAAVDTRVQDPGAAAVATLDDPVLDARWLDVAVVWLQWEERVPLAQADDTVAWWFSVSREQDAVRLLAAAPYDRNRTEWDAALSAFLHKGGFPADMRFDEAPPTAFVWNGTLAGPGNVTALVARLGGPDTGRAALDDVALRSFQWDADDGYWSLRLGLAHKAVPLDDVGHELLVTTDDRVGFGAAVPEHRSELHLHAWLRDHMAAADLPPPRFQEWHSIYEC